MTTKLNTPVVLSASQRSALARFLKHLEANDAPSALVPIDLIDDVDDLVDAFNAIDGGARDAGDYLPDGE